MDRPKISLCIIAKNEEDFIGRCIRSVLPIIHETVLLDTGSTDRTVEIAASLGAKISHRTWTGDFAEARNANIESATGDWILVLDADESIAERDLPVLAALTSDRKLCTEFFQRHYSDDYRLSGFTPVTGEYPEEERGHAGYFESKLVRLYPHREGITYRGKVHELVEQSIRELGRHTIRFSPVRIHHYGHTTAVKRKKNKGTLYTPLGQAKVDENPNDWKNQFELGIEHNNNGRPAESEQAFLRSITLNPNYLSTWVNLGYVQCELRKYPQAIETLKRALQLDPRSEEAFCNLGVVFMRTQELAKAEAMLRRAITCNSSYVNAYNNLAITLAQSGRLAEAAQILYRVRELVPSDQTSLQRLASLYAAAGQPEIAQRFWREEPPPS